MTDNFNILDNGVRLNIASNSTPNSTDGVIAITEIGRITIPSEFVRNGTVIDMQATFSTGNISLANTLYLGVYASSINPANFIFDRTVFSSNASFALDRTLFIQDGNLFMVAKSAYEQTGQVNTPISLSITLNSDLPIIFTGAMAIATPGDYVKLHGYYLDVLY